MSTEELLRQLEDSREAYLASVNRIHEALSKSLIAASQTLPAPSNTNPRPPSEVQAQRLSIGGHDRPLSGIWNASIGPSTTYKSSLVSGETHDQSDDELALFVQDPLPKTSFDEQDLRCHLKDYKWNKHTWLLLRPLLRDESRLRAPNLFSSGEKDDGDDSYSLYQAFDVGGDGSPVPLHDRSEQSASRGQIMWDIMKNINTDPAKRQAVGRITVLREPSPTLFAAVHLTMNKVFDMDKIYNNLVHQGVTHAHMNRAYSQDPREQRSYIFFFEYFTIIDEDCKAMSWQESAQERDHKFNQIRISRCSSTVALSLVGRPLRKLKNPARRAKTKEGFVYNPWDPWHVLHITCYPDAMANTDCHESSDHYVNGPEAFLTTLLDEYRDAQKRFEKLSQSIERLITPPPRFMFDSEMRDKLLFEDDDFTYSRRYFWAFQTIGALNQSIKAMVDAYEDNLTTDVWEGRHKTIWPLTENTARDKFWKKRMALLREDFEEEIEALKTIMRENDDRRTEIKNLRDNIFSGTSVLESRKSVRSAEITVNQGHNIKLLTLVNMFFLPLTFVTSVYGMTNMDPTASFWRFGLTTSLVCIPFFLLIGSLNTNVGMRFWLYQGHKLGAALEHLFHLFGATYRSTDTTSRRTDTGFDFLEPPDNNLHESSPSRKLGEPRSSPSPSEPSADNEKEPQDENLSAPPKRQVSFVPAGARSLSPPLESEFESPTPADGTGPIAHLPPSATMVPQSHETISQGAGRVSVAELAGSLETSSRSEAEKHGLRIWDRLLSNRKKSRRGDDDV